MSRTWERKVRKNTNLVNKQRKKQGITRMTPGAEQVQRFKGRSYIAPILLILFIGMYVFMVSGDPTFKMTTMFWVTVVCYIFLALIFFLRRPYIAVGKDYVQTRKFTGDKRLTASAIKGISVQAGYVVIEQQKGASWVFSRLLYRYPTDEISESLKEFSKVNGVSFQQK